MRDIRDEILNQALELELQSLQRFAKGASTPYQVQYFQSAIKECKNLIQELRLNGSITP